MKKIIPQILAVVLALFGLATLFMSTSVILDLFGIREKEGNYVLFVVWANFICAVFYLLSIYGLLKVKKWTALLLAISTIILIVAFIGLKSHINSGGIYEAKTVTAMIFRIVLTAVFTILSFAIYKKQTTKIN